MSHHAPCSQRCEHPLTLIRIHVTAGRLRYVAGAPMPPDLATCEVEGRAYSAASRKGAMFKLCRVLVAAGIPDQPYEVLNTAAPGIVSMRGQSIHASAGLKVLHRDARAPRFSRFAPLDETGPQPDQVQAPRRAEGPSGGVVAPGASAPLYASPARETRRIPAAPATDENQGECPPGFPALAEVRS